jgi:hypothetical protein
MDNYAFIIAEFRGERKKGPVRFEIAERVVIWLFTCFRETQNKRYSGNEINDAEKAPRREPFRP